MLKICWRKFKSTKKHIIQLFTEKGGRETHREREKKRSVKERIRESE